jgi:hypothetical protein
MTEPSPLTKMKMLRDAGYNHYSEPWENYEKAVDFIKHIMKHTCCLCEPESCISCNALKLLREIGELE